MKKRICYVITIFIFALVLFPHYIFGAEDNQITGLIDDAGVLNAKEYEEISQKLEEVSKNGEMDVAALTVNSLEGKSSMEYADDFYDSEGCGFGPDHDGILFLVSVDDREWYITTCGYGITVFTDKGLDFISKKTVKYLSDDQYAEAFREYADWSARFIKEARDNKPYDTGHMPKEKLPLKWLFYDLIGGTLIILFYALYKASKMKSAVFQQDANEYTRHGSMVLSERNDIFIGRNTTMRKIEKQEGSLTHISSSGEEHGGKGGSF